MNTESSAAQTHAGWRKSSYSTATGACVELCPVADGGVLLRHSKHSTAGTITFPHDAWMAFIGEASGDLTSTNRVVTITEIGTDTIVAARATQVVLRFDENEWTAFLAGIADGEFNFTP